jgi:hypothetical protein
MSMDRSSSPAPVTAAAQIALDIGSTVVKIAHVGSDGQLQSQQFFPRDFDAGIARQVSSLLAQLGIDAERDRIVACSSANGGLRVGIVCLSKHFSGAALRNQVLLAGANPVYVHDLDEATGDPRRVDILLVGGGIDCADASPAEHRLQRFDPARYRYSAMVYAGNRFLADGFAQRFPGTTVIANPLGETLSNRVGSVFECVRRAYLDDLVYKEGVTELPAPLARSIRPTPEVASRGFLRSVLNQSTFTIVGACIALDIGGATTDLHYTVEVVADDSPERPSSGVSVARYVFTDLGIVASRDTLLMQLRSHPQLYEFLCAVRGADVRELYAELREGEHEPSAELLSYACLFLALDRFSTGRGPGLPVGQLDRVAQLILTGGAAQVLDEAVVGRIVALLLAPTTPAPLVQIDRRYEIWVAGITWTEDLQS